MRILESAIGRLRAAGIESPRLEARLLLARAMNADQLDLISERVVPDESAAMRFEALVTRRAAHEPLAYILGRREFFSLDFEVGPGVLIPRPESEFLIEAALKRYPARDATLDVLDLGTGSGCLLLTFLSERPNARGIGIDISETALIWAQKNAQKHGLQDRARFVRDDWGRQDGVFDVVLVNPPYVKSGDIKGLAPEIADHEPATALDGGVDGLAAYRTLAPLILKQLHADGAAFVEVGQSQAEGVAIIFEKAGFLVEGTVNDLARIKRCLVMVAGEQHSRANRKKRLEKEPRSG
jgi:release factor glutamine methyltransferase